MIQELEGILSVMLYLKEENEIQSLCQVLGIIVKKFFKVFRWLGLNKQCIAISDYSWSDLITVGTVC